MSKQFTWIFAALAIFSIPLCAEDAPKPVVNVVADTPETFTAAATKVRGEMESGGLYETISSRDKAAVDDGLKQMAAMLERSGSVAKMQESEKIALFNEQEKVNGLLTDNANNRLICSHERPIGSRIPVTTCHTLAELRMSNTNGKAFMQNTQQQSMGARGAVLDNSFNNPLPPPGH